MTVNMNECKFCYNFFVVLHTCAKDSSGSGWPLHLWAMYCLHYGRCWLLTGLLLSGLDKGGGLALLQAEDWLRGLYVRAGGAHWAAGIAKDRHMLHWSLCGLESWWNKPMTIYNLCTNVDPIRCQRLNSTHTFLRFHLCCGIDCGCGRSSGSGCYHWADACPRGGLAPCDWWRLAGGGSNLCGLDISGGRVGCTGAVNRWNIETLCHGLAEYSILIVWQVLIKLI